jgi:hypothetical protein
MKPITVQNYIDWIIPMKAVGVNEVIEEIGNEPYPLHVYALRGSKLMGYWNRTTNIGTIYEGKGVGFEKRNRSFKKVQFK